MEHPTQNIDAEDEYYEGDLSPEERQAFEQLLQRLNDEEQSTSANKLSSYYKDRKIALRFIRGKKFVVDNAIACMHKHMEVVKEMGGIDIATVGDFLSHGVIVVPPTTRDKSGRKTLFLYGSRMPKHEGEFDRARAVCYMAETLVLRSPQTQRLGVTLVANAAKLPFSMNRAAVRRLAHVVQNAYPLRLNGMIVYNAPWYFRLFFGAISIFLKPKIRERIRLVNKEELLNLIDPEQIPEDWDPSVGKLEFNFVDWLNNRYEADGVKPSAEAQARLDELQATLNALKSSKPTSSSTSNTPATPQPALATPPPQKSTPTDQSTQ